jgi:thioredoxin 2
MGICKMKRNWPIPSFPRSRKREYGRGYEKLCSRYRERSNQLYTLSLLEFHRWGGGDRNPGHYLAHAAQKDVQSDYRKGALRSGNLAASPLSAKALKSEVRRLCGREFACSLLGSCAETRRTAAEARARVNASSISEPQMIRCAACGAVNRVPVDRIRDGMAPVCGRCKAPLALPTGPLVVTDATFAEQVERSPLPVLVDIWAPWCGPCRMVAPVVEELSRELAGRIRVAKLNADENPVTSSRFSIQSIPALLLFQNGSEIDRIVGAQPKAEIMRRIQRAIPR